MRMEILFFLLFSASTFLLFSSLLFLSLIPHHRFHEIYSFIAFIDITNLSSRGVFTAHRISSVGRGQFRRFSEQAKERGGIKNSWSYLVLLFFVFWLCFALHHFGKSGGFFLGSGLGFGRGNGGTVRKGGVGGMVWYGMDGMGGLDRHRQIHGTANYFRQSRHENNNINSNI